MHEGFNCLIVDLFDGTARSLAANKIVFFFVEHKVPNVFCPSWWQAEWNVVVLALIKWGQKYFSDSLHLRDFREAICNRASGLDLSKTREDQTNAEWKCFPVGEIVFFRSNLVQREPSCSLVKFCSTDSPTHPALSSCQAQSTHTDRPWSTKPWLPKHEVKKENNLSSLRLPLPDPTLWNSSW